MFLRCLFAWCMVVGLVGDVYAQDTDPSRILTVHWDAKQVVATWTMVVEHEDADMMVALANARRRGAFTREEKHVLSGMVAARARYGIHLRVNGRVVVPGKGVELALEPSSTRERLVATATVPWDFKAMGIVGASGYRIDVAVADGRGPLDFRIAGERETAFVLIDRELAQGDPQARVAKHLEGGQRLAVLVTQQEATVAEGSNAP